MWAGIETFTATFDNLHFSMVQPNLLEVYRHFKLREALEPAGAICYVYRRN